MRFKEIAACLSLCIMILASCSGSGRSSDSNYVGEAETYWVNSYLITDYHKDVRCPVYRNQDKHCYDIDYEGERYELIREIPIDVNGDGSLILRYRFKDMDHYIADIP